MADGPRRRRGLAARPLGACVIRHGDDIAATYRSAGLITTTRHDHVNFIRFAATKLVIGSEGGAPAQSRTSLASSGPAQAEQMAHHPGCSRCADADGTVAWIRAGDLGLGREIVRRQPFRGHAAPVPIVRPALCARYCEAIDWAGGNDPQDWPLADGWADIGQLVRRGAEVSPAWPAPPASPARWHRGSGPRCARRLGTGAVPLPGSGGRALHRASSHPPHAIPGRGREQRNGWRAEVRRALVPADGQAAVGPPSLRRLAAGSLLCATPSTAQLS